MKGKVLFVVVWMAVFGSLIVQAQPIQTTEPIVPVTLEEVTATTDFYGQMVAIRGFVQDFVNVNTIVLHENVPLDDDKVLIINTSGIPFAPNIVLGHEIIVTGVVQPERDAWVAGTFTRAYTNVPNSQMTVEPTATADATLAQEADWAVRDALEFYYNGNLPADYNGFTVIEVMDVSMLAVVKSDGE